jgi:hypothetical protein
VSPNVLSSQSFNGLLFFIPERPVILKEKAHNLYPLSAYFIARFIADLVSKLALPVLFLVISYFLVFGQYNAKSFGILLIATVYSCLCAESIGLLIGIAITRLNTALSVTSMVGILLLVLAGFYGNTLPLPISQLRFVSPLTFILSLSLHAVYLPQSGGVLYCDRSGKLLNACGNGISFFSREEVIRELLWLPEKEVSLVLDTKYCCTALVLIVIALRVSAYLVMKRSY